MRNTIINLFTYQILFLFLFIASSNKALAQFTDSTHYHIALSATGSVNRAQAANSYLITNVLSLGMKKKDYSMGLNGNYVYGQSNNALTNRDYNTIFNADLFKYTPFPHSFYWALLNYNTSFSLKINNENQGGLGFAYSLIDTKNSYLNFSDGVVYDQSDLIVHDSIPYSYHIYRNSFRLAFHFSIKDIIVLDGSNYLQNSFKQGSDYVIRSNTSITFKLRKWIGLTTALVYNKMNRTDSENFLFTYGLTVDKYF